MINTYLDAAQAAPAGLFADEIADVYRLDPRQVKAVMANRSRNISTRLRQAQRL
jgi:hypothetical protein